jgi:hypothetical protein
MGRCELSICDGTKVGLDKNEDATGAKDAGEFLYKMWVVMNLWRLDREQTVSTRQGKVARDDTYP